jgi:TRAP-type mannitol/chloroaromatic compound transport system substrate-binding protein
MMVSRVPIPHVADVKGVKIGADGPGAKGLQELGANVIFVVEEDAYTSLASGLIDAYQSGTPTGNYASGWQEVSKYWIMPCLQNGAFTYVANADFWAKISAADKALFADIFNCVSGMQHMEAEYGNFAVLEKVRSEGITVQTWDNDDLQTFGKAIEKVMDKFPDDPDWVTAYNTLMKYRQDMGY